MLLMFRAAVVPKVWVSPAKPMLSISLPSASAKILIKPPVFSVGGASKVSASIPNPEGTLP